MTVTIASGSQEGLHPRREYLHRPPGVPVKILQSSAPVSTAAAKWLVEATPVGRIGTDDESGPVEHVFGRIGGVALGPDDRVYVVDRRLNNVRVFSTTGDHLATIGRPGQGPGEFASPRSIALTGGSPLQVYVGDRAREVDVFEKDAAAYRFRRRIPTPQFNPDSLCVSEELVTVVEGSATDAGAVKVLDQDGTVLASFGRLYESEHGTLNKMLGTSRVACHPEQGLLVVGTQDIGDIFGYQGSSLRWIATGPEFRENAHFRVSGPSVMSQMPEIGHRLDSVAITPFGSVLVQLSRWRRGDNRMDRISLDSFEIDIATGEPVFVGDTLPRIAALSANYFVAVLDDYETMLSVHRLAPARSH